MTSVVGEVFSVKTVTEQRTYSNGSLDEFSGTVGEEGVACRYCGTAFLYWGETDKGWRLFNNEGNIHLCKSKPQLVLKGKSP